MPREADALEVENRSGGGKYNLAEDQVRLERADKGGRFEGGYQKRPVSEDSKYPCERSVSVWLGSDGE